MIIIKIFAPMLLAFASIKIDHKTYELPGSGLEKLSFARTLQGKGLYSRSNIALIIFDSVIVSVVENAKEARHVESIG